MQRIGSVELNVLSDGSFALDGGAMFGIVPRPVWEKKLAPDARHRVRLGLNPFLVRSGGKTILFDSGIGDRRDPRFADDYSVDHGRRDLPRTLKDLGVAPEDVDLVVPSHLHLDHAGWLTRREGNGFVPTFPRATYLVQEGTWEEALDANPRTRGSYIETDFLPLEGRLKLLKGSEEVAPGVWVECSSGHVRHHQIVRIRSGGRQAALFGDLMPTTAHLKPGWTMGYDLDPKGVAELRAKMIDQAVREGWLIGLDHDPQHAIVRLVPGEKGVQALPVEAVLP
jgi:glyoxylase-like metal-dependent hydrolase (beta-lactamase superfamily II)